MRHVVGLLVFLSLGLAQDNFIGRTLDAEVWLEQIEIEWPSIPQPSSASPSASQLWPWYVPW
jgi:hypothetical protein